MVDDGWWTGLLEPLHDALGEPGDAMLSASKEETLQFVANEAV